MSVQTHWVYDDFYPSAAMMRQKIDDHFTESVAVRNPFSTRSIWNYWHIPDLYTYLRTEPRNIYPEIHESFMEFLRNFAARKFGLVIPHNPYLSMYINGCGQTIHNDAKNGRLAYVFSLTRWKERHFHGGETLIYKLGEDAYKRSFDPNAGHGFYDAIEPQFNRLAIFDDRAPHSVNPIQGTMNPLDARFVIHGHMEEPMGIPFSTGGLANIDLARQFMQLRTPILKLFEGHGYHGFIAVQVHVEPTGIVSDAIIKQMQLMPLDPRSDTLHLCLHEVMDHVHGYVWPVSEKPSRLVFALSSTPLRRGNE